MFKCCRITTRRLATTFVTRLIVCVALVAPAVLVAAPTQTVDINIVKFAFAPKEITISPGTTIVWTNHDETPHTVTSTDKTFASKGLDTNDKFEHQFAAEGDFSYRCTLHPFMSGVVHVRKQ